MFNSLKYPNKRKSSYINIQPNMFHYNTRFPDEFLLPQFRINQVKNNYDYQALSMWNGLPDYIKRAKSVNI